MARAPARRLVLAMALLGGCGDSAPDPTLEHVEPVSAYTDRAQRLILRGHGFLPSFRVDPASGHRQSDATGFWGYVGVGPESKRLLEFGWRGPDELSATLEKGLLPGPHAVTVVDPRGRRAQLEMGFSALGGDDTAPQVTFVSPAEGALIAPGSRVKVELRVSDQPGHLKDVSWEALGPSDVLLTNSCTVPPEAAAIGCQFDVLVPATLRAGDRFGLRVYARDDSPSLNETHDVRWFPLVPAPEVGQVRPASGGEAGGTEVLVTGSGFIPGSRVLVGGLPLVPDGGIRLNETTFTGRTPAHGPGVVAVTVETRVGAALVATSFEYVPAPRPTSIAPAEARAEGGDEIHVMGDNFSCNTRIYLGTKLATAAALDQLTDVVPCTLGRKEIVGRAPAGRGRTTVWAFDAASGWGSLPDAFTWLAPPDASAQEDTAAP